MDEAIQKFHEEHEVVYTLMAVVDGEVVAKHTSSISADDVSGFATLTDEAMQTHIIDDANGRAEYLAESEAETQMEQERGN
ncbi:MAG: hypothetical protein ACOH18_05515 [Candidatus Saccharimonadaceae bacterium]